MALLKISKSLILKVNICFFGLVILENQSILELSDGMNTQFKYAGMIPEDAEH